MDDFNAKKSRAHKMRQDKSRDKPRKNVSSGGVSSKGPSRNINTDRVLGTEDVSEKSSCEPAQTGRDNVEVTIKTFTKRKLASNWDRYEENLNLNKYEKEDDGVGAQYEELLSMPVSGGHFKLKHEKEWEKERSELQMQWFQLNLQAIEKNLTTIPFYTRQSLPKHIFSESQIHHMDVRAKQNAASLAEINEGILKIQNLRLSDPETKEKLGTTHKNTPPIKMLQLEEESIEDSKKSSEMEDLDKLLVLQDGESKNTTGKQSGTSVDLLTQENYPESSPEPAKALAQDLTHLPSLQPAVSSSASDLDKPTVSLDDWLDSILDD